MHIQEKLASTYLHCKLITVHDEIRSLMNEKILSDKHFQCPRHRFEFFRFHEFHKRRVSYDTPPFRLGDVVDNFVMLGFVSGEDDTVGDCVEAVLTCAFD
jgi:hypothetical protein